jgi:hypothetical protein
LKIEDLKNFRGVRTSLLSDFRKIEDLKNSEGPHVIVERLFNELDILNLQRVQHHC